MQITNRLCGFATIVAILTVLQTGWSDHLATEARLLEDVKFLASDALEGRGIETEGIKKAAEFVRTNFQHAGLQSGVDDGSFYQKFGVPLSFRVTVDKTQLRLKSPTGEAIPLKMDVDYVPLCYGGSGPVQAPIVFVGYGISAPEYKYDDYANVDVAGKVVLMMRREPQQADDNSVFDGKKTTKHAGIIEKVQTAWAKKAVGVLLVSEPFSAKTSADDPLLKFDYLPQEGPVAMPMAQLKQTLVNRLLADTPLESLTKAEATIDANLKPISTVIPGWSIDGELAFEKKTIEQSNVLGVLPGDGPTAAETIIIGAHYDHLGFGGNGSLAPNSTEIHNGADDNASGTAVLIELARRFGQRPQKPARSLVFIAFSAEERGLLGSRHYVKKDPIRPLEKTVAMINYDMVGRLSNDAVTIYGENTSPVFKPLFKDLDNANGIKFKEPTSLPMNSDHFSFYQANIPVLHLFTGSHKDYHRPSDDTEKLNIAGMRIITDLSESLIDRLLAAPGPFEFVKQNEDPHAGMKPPGSGKMAYLGTVPDYGEETAGVLLNGVNANSPAEKGGLQTGDIIVAFDGLPVKNVQGLTFNLYKHKPGDVVEITVERQNEKKVLKVTLGTRGEEK